MKNMPMIPNEFSLCRLCKQQNTFDVSVLTESDITDLVALL